VLENEDVLFCVLDYCDHQDRSSFLFLSRTHGSLLTSEASFKWRLERLHKERGLYAPTYRLDSPPGQTWKSTFEELWRRRDIWVGSSISKPRRVGGRSNSQSRRKNATLEKKRDTFRISVCARLKPRGVARPTRAPSKSAIERKKIALPLHQRLELIRMNRNLSSRKEALEVLRDQRGWFGALEEGSCVDGYVGDEEKNEEAVIWLNGKSSGSTSGASEDVDAEDSLDNTTSAPSLRGGIHFFDKEDGRIIVVDPTKGLREFAFNAVDDGASQSDFYDTTALPLVGDVINGHSATCLVYGQTGSGKTHAMFGPPAPAAEGGEKSLGLNAKKVAETWGIVPRACSQLFGALDHRRKSLNIEIDASVSMSYVEVFGDKVVDLLRGGAKCGQSRVAAQRFVLDGSAEVPVQSLDDAFRLLNAGEAQKRKAATAMNDRSSRAHTIFIATLRQKCTSTGADVTSRLFLADLGGSEKAKKSQPIRDSTNTSRSENADEAIADTRTKNEERLREAANINLGLLSLKRCVDALVKRQRKGNRAHIHVPYSENKLTMLLSSGLGGNNKTCIVVCAAQEEEHGPETVAALRFGQMCGGVSKTLMSVGSGATEEGARLRDLLTRIDASIARCEDNIMKHEQWVTRKENRVDERAQGSDYVEVRTTTVLVGAEKYRLEMEDLLRKRAELVGEPLNKEIGV